MGSVTRSIAHGWSVFKIFIMDGIAYPATGLIWVLTDGINVFTMPFVWAAVAKSGMVGGYTASQFVGYYLSMLLVASFVVSHFMWDISMEIKEGQFTNYLMRPVSYFGYMVCRNFSWRIVRTVLATPIFLLALLLYSSFLPSIELHFSGWFWVSLLLGHFLSISFVLALSMIALFVQEATSIFELYYFPMLFLSGQIFPVNLLPDWARAISHATPFYYTSGVPVEILTGRIGVESVPQVLMGQCLWILFSVALFKWLWKLGLRHYVGTGM